MPCYLQPISIPNREEYALWKRLGYTRPYEDYCALKAANFGGTMIICGQLGPPCPDCGAVSDFLCDFPVGNNNQTCDRPMCGQHVHEVGANLHYCDTHYKIWREFFDSADFTAALKNVVPFKKTP